MAAKKATAKKAAPPFADHIDKESTESTKLFIEWLEENTGYEVDETSVRLTRSLVGEFQKSDVNQDRLQRNREAAAAAKSEKKAAPKKRASSKKAAPKAEENGDEEETPKPAPKARRRRRPVAAAADE